MVEVKVRQIAVRETDVPKHYGRGEDGKFPCPKPMPGKLAPFKFFASLAIPWSAAVLPKGNPPWKDPELCGVAMQ